MNHKKEKTEERSNQLEICKSEIFKKEDLNLEKEYIHGDAISIGIEYLADCLNLDSLTLDGMWSKSQWENELSDEKRLSMGIFWNSKLIAVTCGWLIQDELQITFIAVNPKNQKQGLGRKILSQILKKAHELGATKAFLESKSTNSSAISLYLNSGFRIDRRRKHYYQDGSDAFTFSCNL